MLVKHSSSDEESDTLNDSYELLNSESDEQEYELDLSASLKQVDDPSAS
jgi:hypothetical protein